MHAATPRLYFPVLVIDQHWTQARVYVSVVMGTRQS
jgi:hypothetical protein